MGNRGAPEAEPRTGTEATKPVGKGTPPDLPSHGQSTGHSGQSLAPPPHQPCFATPVPNSMNTTRGQGASSLWLLVQACLPTDLDTCNYMHRPVPHRQRGRGNAGPHPLADYPRGGATAGRVPATPQTSEVDPAGRSLHNLPPPAWAIP